MSFVTNYYSLIAGFPTLLVIIEFFYFINRDKRLLRSGAAALDIMILVVPLVLWRMFEMEGRLAPGEALFDPKYGNFIYTLILLCQLAYFYCSFRKKPSSPLPEVLINCLLITGIILNMIIAVRMAAIQAIAGILFICMPAAMLFMLMLVHNHRLMIYTLEDVNADYPEPARKGRLSSIFLYLLQMQPVGKVLLLITLCLPVIALLIKILVMSAGYTYHYTI
jgi:hypothetical protein